MPMDQRVAPAFAGHVDQRPVRPGDDRSGQLSAIHDLAHDLRTQRLVIRADACNAAAPATHEMKRPAIGQLGAVAEGGLGKHDD